MLVLSRKPGESIAIGDVLVKVLRVEGNRVKLGFVAPAEVHIKRTELLDSLYETLFNLKEQGR
jgi:carbon storage regulator CsrA